MKKISVIGIGANGIDSLLPDALACLKNANCVFGAARHLDALNLDAEMVAWPSPFDHLIAEIEARADKYCVVLATGDPLWFSVGRKLAAYFGDRIVFYPQLSSFQLAASRLQWSLEACDCISLHGRPIEKLVNFLQPNARILCLTSGSDAPKEIAGLLKQNGFGGTVLHVLGDLGAKSESHQTFQANDAGLPNLPDLHVLGIEISKEEPGSFLPNVIGLPDDAFANDGKMTKRVVRAATLTKLMPHREALLWDIGAGSGSVGIEWMRAAPDTRAIAIEPRADRRALIAENARNLGAPDLEIIDGEVPAGLAGLATPDAVFIGGGLSSDVFAIAMEELKLGGRLVANAVTLESEAILLAAFQEHGGEMERISVERADQIGPRFGWRPAMPVMQWSWVKR